MIGRDYKMQGLLRKLQYDTIIDNNLNYYDTIEGNLRRFEAKGIKVSKRRLLKFIDEYEVEMKTDKEVNYQKIIDIYKEKPLSSRKMEKIANDMGIKVTYRTIQKLINNYKQSKL